MPLTHRVDAETGVIWIETSGDPALDEQRDVWALALLDPAAARPLRILDDRRAIERFGEREDVRRTSSALAETLEQFEGARIAFVASSPVTYGMTRMFEGHTAELPVEVRAFFEPEEALAWLLRA